MVVGQEPVTAEEEPELVSDGIWTAGSEWCTNLECPSNHLKGLHRVGVNDYVCLDCAETLRTPIGQVFAHRRDHRGQSDQPGDPRVPEAPSVGARVVPLGLAALVVLTALVGISGSLYGLMALGDPMIRLTVIAALAVVSAAAALFVQFARARR